MPRYEAHFAIEPLFAPCSEELLQQVSRQLARPLPLPEEYLDFLRQWNGAILFTGEMVILQLEEPFEEQEFTVHNLYGIPTDTDCATPEIAKDSERFNLRLGGSHYDFDERVHSHWLAIGEGMDRCSRICISLGEQNYGEVNVWNPVTPWELDQRDEHGNYKIRERDLMPAGNSFSQFWKMLQTEEENEEYWRKRDAAMGEDEEIDILGRIDEWYKKRGL